MVPSVVAPKTHTVSTHNQPIAARRGDRNVIAITRAAAIVEGFVNSGISDTAAQ